MEKCLEQETIQSILQMYGFDESITEQKSYFHYIGEDGLIKLIYGITLENGQKIVIKILHEDEDLIQEMQKIEKQSIFSEVLRGHGIKTPIRYQINGKYCNEYIYCDIPCVVTVEEWCGEEIAEINIETAYQIGTLMARMHKISLENKCEIGCGTLFSAAYWNDVDAYPEFCKTCEDENLDQTLITKIKTLHDEKLACIRAVWDKLPRSAVQGDISINNLTYDADELTVFDYNNAGDEVLISDLVMEGLLTAYEMDLPDGTPISYREHLFPSLLKGYLSVRPLSDLECYAAWEIYTLYHGLWFSRVIYHDHSLEMLVKRKDYDTANKLLYQMLTDMTQQDDSRFRNATPVQEPRLTYSSSQ